MMRFRHTGLPVFAALFPFIDYSLLTIDQARREVTPHRGGSMVIGSDKAAEAALIVLGAMVDPDRRSKAVRLEAKAGSAGTRAEAVTVLSRLPKPLECSALVIADTLVVRCGTITPAQAHSFNVQRTEIAQGRGFMGEIRATYLGHDNARVLLLGHGERLVLTAREIELWFEEYLIVGSLSLGGRLPEGDEQRDGVVFVVEASSVTDYKGPVPPD
jgi:hypothetical protein